MLIRNALIHDSVTREPYAGDIRILNGKIAEIGKIVPEADEEIIDARGLNAYPGFVDAHSHIGLDAYGGPTGGTYDYNEMNDIVCPQLRGMDSYHPMDAAIPAALAAGVTTVCTGPGSANVLGGTAMVIKLYGNSVEEAALIPQQYLPPCAQGWR